MAVAAYSKTVDTHHTSARWPVHWRHRRMVAVHGNSILIVKPHCLGFGDPKKATQAATPSCDRHQDQGQAGTVGVNLRLHSDRSEPWPVWECLTSPRRPVDAALVRPVPTVVKNASASKTWVESICQSFSWRSFRGALALVAAFS